MRSIKPGRGPSGMSFVGSIVAIVFGIFWTIIAAGITSNVPFGGVGGIFSIFPLFGVLFIIVGIVQAVYHYKNATGRDRFSMFDITDSSEEGDPSDKWIKNNFEDNISEENSSEENMKDSNENGNQNSGYNSNQNINPGINNNINYCPYCGNSLNKDFLFCPKCGKRAKL